MANDWTNVLALGLTWTSQLFQQVCMVVVVVLILLRMGWLRAAVYGAKRNVWHALIAIALFTVLAVIGTHRGIVINVEQGAVGEWPAALPTRLADDEAVMNFRDLFVIAAGLIGGPFVRFRCRAIGGSGALLWLGWLECAALCAIHHFHRDCSGYVCTPTTIAREKARNRNPHGIRFSRCANGLNLAVGAAPRGRHEAHSPDRRRCCLLTAVALAYSCG